jgi:hypothetical protein
MHESTDDTPQIGREHGAHSLVVPSDAGRMRAQGHSGTLISSAVASPLDTLLLCDSQPAAAQWRHERSAESRWALLELWRQYTAQLYFHAEACRASLAECQLQLEAGRRLLCKVESRLSVAQLVGQAPGE